MQTTRYNRASKPTTRQERRREFMRAKKEKDAKDPKSTAAIPYREPIGLGSWADDISDDEGECRTQNGALSNVSSEDALVNLYFRLVPGIEPHDAEQLIEAAYSASPLGLLRLAFDVRNCRGGKGRRQLFYFVSDYLMCGTISRPETDPSSSSSSPSSSSSSSPSSKRRSRFDRKRAEAWLYNLEHVAHYGYFKDLWALFESATHAGFPAEAEEWVQSSLQKEVLDIYASQLERDCKRLWNVTPAEYHAGGTRLPVPEGPTPSISLAAKYAPTSGKRFDKSLGVTALLCQRLGLSARSYRWMVSDMRGVIDVVEKKMSAGEWTDIQLSKLPSVALLRSRQALQRHLPEQWKEFKELVRAGETKVNVGQLQPYELVKVLMDKHDDDLELLLGEYVRKHGTAMKNVAVVADTSGSMMGCGTGPRPIDVCMALTLLAAENAEGAMAKRYFAFSDHSEELVIQGATYHDKLRHAMAGPWGMNTNVQAVFAQILAKMKAGQDIRTVMIISDMQFDACGSGQTNFDAIEASFKAAGLARPVLVFWNVSALGKDYPVKADTNGTILISGCSPSLFQMIVDAPDNVSPSMFVRSIIDKPDYARIQLPPEGEHVVAVEDDSQTTPASSSS